MSSPLYPRKPIFQLDFSQGEYGVRRKGGEPTGVEFDGNYITFTKGISSGLMFDRQFFGSEFSLRMRFRVTDIGDTSSYRYIVTIKNKNLSTNYIYVRIVPSTNILYLSGWGTVTRYVNSVVYTNTDIVEQDKWYDIVVTTSAANIRRLVLGDSNYSIDIDLVEIYNTVLTPEEISLLYQNKLYKKPTLNTLLDITSVRGVLEDKAGNSFTNNSVQVVRDGSQWVMKFVRNTSKIDCGSFDDLTGDKTALAWIKPYYLGGVNSIFNNGNFRVDILNNKYLYVYSNGVTFQYSHAEVDMFDWLFIAVVRKANGDASIYFNQTMVRSGFTGTPTAGTTNLFIGNNDPSNWGFSGLISGARIIDGLLTAEEITQIYTSEKHLYQ